MAVKFNWKQSQIRDWPSSHAVWQMDIESPQSRATLLMSLMLDGEANDVERLELESLMHQTPQLEFEYSLMKSISMNEADIPLLDVPGHLRESIFAATIDRQSFASRLFSRRVNTKLKYAFPVGSLAVIAFTAVMFSVYTHTLLKTQPVRHEKAAPRHDIEVAINTKKNHQNTESFFLDETPHVQDIRASQISASGKRAPHRHRNSSSVILHRELLPASSRVAVQAPAIPDAPPVSAVNIAAPASHAETAASAYSTRPMMDANIQRSLMVRAVSTSIPWQEIKVSDELTSNLEKTSAEVDTSKDTNSSVKIRIAHLITSQMPPDSRSIQTSADFKKLRDAANQGYDRETIASIQRGQATVKLVGRF